MTGWCQVSAFLNTQAHQHKHLATCSSFNLNGQSQTHEAGLDMVQILSRGVGLCTHHDGMHSIHIQGVQMLQERKGSTLMACQASWWDPVLPSKVAVRIPAQKLRNPSQTLRDMKKIQPKQRIRMMA